MNTIIEIYRPQAEKRITRQLNRIFQDASDAELPAAAILATGVSSYWSMLLQPARDKLKQYITNTPNMLALPVLAKLSMNPELLPVVKEKIGKLSADELATAISSFNLREPAKERVLQLISQVRSYNSANDILSRLFLPIFDYFAKDDFVKLIKFPKTDGADLNGANVYTIVLKRLQQTEIFDSTELAKLFEENNLQWIFTA